MGIKTVTVKIDVEKLLKLAEEPLDEVAYCVKETLRAVVENMEDSDFEGLGYRFSPPKYLNQNDIEDDVVGSVTFSKG